MGTKCDKCLGFGLISSGAVPHDLSAGNKVKCDACDGRGYFDGTGAPAANPDIAPVQHPIVAPLSEPTEPTPPAVELGGPDEVLPKVGDACVTADNQEGTIQADGEGLKCVPNE